MRKIPLDVGTLHFVGIGGIGMSGIAEILLTLGYTVQGSDQKESTTTKRLSKKGATVMIGHDADHVAGVDVVIRSSAIKDDNPEIKAALQGHIPIIPRAEMLAEIMRLKWSIGVAGTHGKTTTTSLVAQILRTADMDPTVINGGIINSYGTNAVLGTGDWMVVESDESDGSFTKLRPTIGIVTNIEPEHMEHYGTYENLEKGFETFVRNIPFYGFCVMCIDHPNVQKLIPNVSDKKIITYGFSPQADVKGTITERTPQSTTFDVEIADYLVPGGKHLKGVTLAMVGEHNVANALAAIGVGIKMGVEEDALKKALESFEGVKRRFTFIGESNGIRVFDDYGHHPTEIMATLKAARAANEGDIIAVFQPHRYSRVSNLFKEFCTSFNDADTVIVSKIYAANEPPVEGVTQDTLINGLQQYGHKNVLKLESPEQLAQLVAHHAKKGDIIVCLGAGNITAWANNLPDQLDDTLKPGHAA